MYFIYRYRVALYTRETSLAMMLFTRTTFAEFALVVIVSLTGPVSALWPIPRALQTGSTPLILAKNFQIVSVRSSPSDLDDAVSRTIGHLNDDKLQRLVVGRASTDKATVQHAKQLSSLVLSIPNGKKVNSIMEEAIKPIGSRSEEYTLHVPSDGSPATLAANSTLGLLRGLTTFEQLWYDLDGAATYTLEAPISISDSPAFVSVCIEIRFKLLNNILAIPWIYAGHCSEFVSVLSPYRRVFFLRRSQLPCCRHQTHP